MPETHVHTLRAENPALLRDSLNIQIQDLQDQGFTVLSIECEGDTCHIWYEAESC